MTVVTRWWWVRHAPVTSNDGKIYGQDDFPCDCSDEALFQQVAGMLPKDAVCVTSDLQRTHQTADALIKAGLTFAERHEEPDFKEQSFGDWQGLTYKEFGDLRDNLAHRYWLAPAVERSPNGESFMDLMSRVGPSITKLTAAHENKDIIAVTHGGTIRAAVGLATGCGAESALAYSVDNVSVTRLDHIQGQDTNQWRLGFINWLPRRGDSNGGEA